MAEYHTLVLQRDIVPIPANASFGAAVPGADQTYQFPASLFTKSFIGLGNVSNTKNNFGAASGPSTSDDSSDGYSVGSFWSHDESAWVLTDASVNAAVWTSITATVVTVIDGGDANGD